MGSARTEESKVTIIYPREIVLSHQAWYRTPLFTYVDAFLKNPSEITFNWICKKLTMKSRPLVNKDDKRKWADLIYKLKEKEKTDNIPSSELLLIAIDYLFDYSSPKTSKLAYDYFMKIKYEPNNISYAIALYSRGNLHFHGHGTPVNMAEHRRCMREAVENGSEFALGALLLDNLIDQSRLLDKTHFYCLYSLGMAFQRQQKFDQAYRYFSEAAILGCEYSPLQLADMYSQGIYLEKDAKAAALFYGSYTYYQNSQLSKNKITKLLSDHPEHALFFQYQIAMIDKDSASLNKLFSTHPGEALECMIESNDLWSEVQPLLNEANVRKIEEILDGGLEVLRGKGLNTSIATLVFDYVGVSTGLTTNLPTINEARFLEEQARPERVLAEKNDRFKKSIKAHIEQRRRDLRKAEVNRYRSQDWTWAQPVRGERPQLLVESVATEFAVSKVKL